MQHRTIQEAIQLVYQLKNQHGLSEYLVRFTDRNKKKHSIASCNYKFKRFDFVEFYALHMTDDDFKEVILHEIAHALTPGHGHDAYFRAVCLRIGGVPTAKTEYLYLKDIRPEHLKQKINFIYECPTCQHQMQTTKRVKRNYSCPKCNPRRYDERFKLVLVEDKRENNKLNTPIKIKKQPERLQGFSLS